MKLAIVLASCLIWIGSVADAGIVWDEALDGDLSNFSGSPTPIVLMNGINDLFGTIGGTSDPNVGDGFDTFTFTLSPNQTLESILITNYQVSGGNTSTGVNIFSGVGLGGTFLGSVAMNTSHVGSDILTLTSIGPLDSGTYTIAMREFTAPNQIYAFSLAVSIPEPRTTALLLIAVVAWISKRRKRN